jgi:hypothetical protein
VIVPTEPVSIAFYAVRGGAADIYTVPPAAESDNVTGDDRRQRPQVVTERQRPRSTADARTTIAISGSASSTARTTG